MTYRFGDKIRAVRERKGLTMKRVRVSDRRRTTSGGVLYERLSHTVTGGEEHALEAYLITVPPGGKSSSDEYGHPGREFGVIHSGRAELAVGTQTVGLASGDSVSFPADVPHGLVNKGKGRSPRSG